MSGIAGIWNLDGRPVERALLARLSATLAHRGPDGERLWVEREFGLASQQSRVTPESFGEIQPLVSPSGTGVVFDGRLDNRAELLEQLPKESRLSTSSPDCALVLAACEASGEDFPKKLKGDFALAVFDSKQRKLILARDGLGARPLYYCRIKETVLFASEIKALLAHPEMKSQPNDDVLAAYLLFRLGARFQDRRGLTLFADVLTVLPAHLVVITPQGMVSRQYWDFDPARKTRFRSFAEYVEGFRYHFDRAVERRLRSAHPVGIMVSGGLDSSSILCLAETMRKRTPHRVPLLFAFHFTPLDGGPGDEGAYIETIERDYGIQIERIGLAGYRNLIDNCREVTRHAEMPFLDVDWNTYDSLRRAAQARGVRVLIGGQWADQFLWNEGYLVDLFYKGAWGQVISHLRSLPKWQTDGDVTEFWRRFLHDLLLYSLPDGLVPWLRKFRPGLQKYRMDRPWFQEAFRQRARRFDAQRSPIPLGKFRSVHARSLYHYARSRHYSVEMETDNKINAMYGIESAFPFWDRDLIQFLMEIPGEMMTYRGVPKIFLRKGMEGILPPENAKRTWKGDWTQIVNEAMMELYPEVLNHMKTHQRAIARKYLDPTRLMVELQKLRPQIVGADCSVSWRIADLVGLELWLETFFPEVEGKQMLLAGQPADYAAPRSTG